MSKKLLKSRGMPTLSLQVRPGAKAQGGTSSIEKWARGRVCVLLFLFLFVSLQFFTTSLFAQDLRNRTEEMYRLGKVVISSEPLPDKVYEAQKNKLLISIIFLEKSTNNVITTGLGTGFISDKPGVILTARHLLSDSMLEMEAMKSKMIKINSRFDYEYEFIGTIITPTAWVNFPLFLVAVGENGTMKDMMALRTNVQTMEQARVVGDLTNPNPLNLLMRTFKFADAKTGEKVYITGFAPVVAGFSDKNMGTTNSYLDMINFTFSAEVLAKIKDMPINRFGVKLIYRLKDSAEPGFSGGLTLNAQGQVVGVTIAVTTSKNFVYAISSKDLRQFLKDHNIK